MKISKRTQFTCNSSNYNLEDQITLVFNKFEILDCLGDFLLFEGGVVEQLFDEVDMTKQHAATAVTLQAQSIQSITFLVLSL